MGNLAFAKLFQECEAPNDPPQATLSSVKDAVKFVKDNAGAWRRALNKEIAAIELTKSRQSDLFAFFASALTGFFMFIATFFSGLALDAMKDGKIPLPEFLNETLYSHPQ